MNTGNETSFGDDHIHDVIIVGGGIAGLAAAHRLEGRDILVLEASGRPGGRILSEAGDNGILNFGAHMFGGPGSVVGDLCAELGLDLRPIEAGLMGFATGTRLLLNNRPALLPLRLPLSLAGRLSLVKAGLRLRAGSARASALLAASDGMDWSEMTARRLAFGDEMTLEACLGRLHPETKRLMQAITERCGGDPSEISAGHGLRSFANVWSASSPGYNLVGGSSRLPEALAATLGGRLRLGCRVTNVAREENGVTVTASTDGGEPLRLRARTAILATPANITGHVAADLPDATRQALAAIRYGPFLSVSLNTCETGPGPLERTYAVSTPQAAFSVLFNQATNRFSLAGHERGGSLMMFAGARRAAGLMQLTDEEIADRFLADLDGLLPGLPAAASPRVRRWEQGAPIAFPGRAALQPALTRPIERIALAGDFLEFANMEAAIRSGYAAAARMSAQL